MSALDHELIHHGSDCWQRPCNAGIYTSLAADAKYRGFNIPGLKIGSSIARCIKKNRLVLIVADGILWKKARNLILTLAVTFKSNFLPGMPLALFFFMIANVSLNS